jgi:hypothetical protein
MFRATGPGQYDIMSESPAAYVLEALVYNFDFDDFDGHKFRPLKIAQTNFLEEHVLPLMDGGKARIWIQGAFSFDCKCLNWRRLAVDEPIVPIPIGKSLGLGFEIDILGVPSVMDFTLEWDARRKIGRNRWDSPLHV